VIVLCDGLGMSIKYGTSRGGVTDPFGTFEEILDELTAL
jgi:hypothetical protein